MYNPGQTFQINRNTLGGHKSRDAPLVLFNALTPARFELIFKLILVIDGRLICEISLTWMSLDVTDNM